MQRLSQELIRQHIEPYTRSPQSNDLCSDIRDYNASLQLIYEIIRNSILKKYTSHVKYKPQILHISIFNKIAWIILKNVLKYYKDNIVHFKKIVSIKDMNLFYRGYDDYTLTITQQKTEEYMKNTRLLWASIDVSLRKLFIEFMKKKKHVL